MQTRAGARIGREQADRGSPAAAEADSHRGEEREIIALPGAEVPVGPEQDAGFILRLHQVLLVDCLGHDPYAIARSVGFEVALDGYHHEVILRGTEHRAKRLCHPNHFERIPFNLDDAAHGVRPFEEFRPQIVADEGRGLLLRMDAAHPDVSLQRSELEIELKYFDGEPVIREIERVSKPGRRVYASVKALPRINNGLGVAIVSTPKGVMADHAARDANVGGEILCTVF